MVIEIIAGILLGLAYAACMAFVFAPPSRGYSAKESSGKSPRVPEGPA